MSHELTLQLVKTYVVITDVEIPATSVPLEQLVLLPVQVPPPPEQLVSDQY